MNATLIRAALTGFDADLATQIADYVELLELASVTDTLTGLANRDGWDAALHHALAYAARTDTPVSVVAIDLDRFKAVNDTHGHAAGDFVLEVVADRIRSHVREYDTAARYGGDEFGLIFPGVTATDAHHLVERLCADIGLPIVLPGGHAAVTIGATAGIADEYATATAIMAAADERMYARKQART
jgi:diguanylate cyclase (GGDEF)-like protein